MLPTKSFLKPLALIALLSGLWPAFSAAEDQKFDDWLLKCDKRCAIQQGLQNPEKPAIQYGIQIVKNQDQYVAAFNFPLGVYLPRGVGIEAGDQKGEFPFVVCLPGGCQGMLILNDELINAFKMKKDLKVRFYITGDKPNEIRFSLKGFTSALEALDNS